MYYTTVPVVAVLAAVVIVIPVLAALWHVSRKRHSTVNPEEPTASTIQSILPSPVEDHPLFRQTDISNSDYIKGPPVLAGSPNDYNLSDLPPMGSGSSSNSGSPCFLGHASFPPALTEFPTLTNLQPANAGSCGTMRFSEAPGSDTEDPDPEVVLRCFRVLVVYSLKVSEAQRKDILSNLVQRLASCLGIEPVCCDIVPVHRKPSLWLHQQVPKADVVLCVCTESCVQDWEVESTMFGTLRMIIETKMCKDEVYSNFATILLRADDARFVPDLLQRNRNFVIDDLRPIVGYIMGSPLCVLPQGSPLCVPPQGSPLCSCVPPQGSPPCVLPQGTPFCVLPHRTKR